MTWTPADQVEHRWHPQDVVEHALVIADQNIVLPSITDKSETVIDLSQNVTFGRPPYTFRLIAHNFPAGAILEPRGVFFFLPDAMLVPGAQYSALVGVRDANNQEAQFTLRAVNAGEGVLLVGGGPIPAAHVGVPFDWTPIITGGRPPYMVFLKGINLPEAGFTADPSTGRLSGVYNGVYGNSPGNLFAVQVWNAHYGTNDITTSQPRYPGYPTSGFDAELAMSWDLLDP